MQILFLALVAFCLAGSGCKEEGIVAPVAPSSALPSAVRSDLPPRAATGNPQPKLPTIKLWVGTNEITAEIASTPNQIHTGMMWRTNMAEMEGMLFVFDRGQRISFYMRNTLLPLTCAYIDPQGNVLETYDMTPRDETSLRSKSDQIQYVLEMNQGWFDRHGVRPGMLLTTQYGSLPETFTRRNRTR